MRGVFVFFIFVMACLLNAQKEKYNIINLKINTEYPHFGLMLIDDSKIIFTSYLLDKKGRPKKVQGNSILTVYEGNLSSTGDIISVVPIQIDLKQKIPFITSATFSPDKQKLYITTGYTSKNRPEGNFNETNFHIKVGEFKAEMGWTNFKVLPFCNPKYSYAHPAFSKDGKALYFTANVRGGIETTKGGSDIFKVDVLGDNAFSEPKNLSTEINSYGRDMFPFISADNTLYFASNRPGGYGGFDIYKSKMNEDGTFEKAEKLPKPLNSNKDDFSFIINSNNNLGYFSSKRLNGKGDDDVYYFTIN